VSGTVSFFVEMKRRKVLRAAFVYMVMSWLLLQITDVVGPILDLPAWVAKLIFFLLLGGLPIALILAWEFDLTSLGIYREIPLSDSGGGVTAGEGSNEVSRAASLVASVWVLFIGIGLSVGAAAVIHLHEARMIDRQFDLVAEEIAHELGHQLKSNNEVLRTLGALFVNNHQPRLDTFRHLAETVLAEHDEIRAIEWVPLVIDADRGPFIDEMRKVYPGFEIKAFDAGGEEIRPEQRDMYFPVTYTVPKIGNENDIGFDLLSNPDRAVALRDAIVSGKTRQTGPIELVQTDASGFLMFNPVFTDDEVPVSQAARLTGLRGFTLAVVDVRKLVTKVVTATPGATNFLGEITIYEAEANSEVPVVRIDSSNGADLSGSTLAAAVVDAGFGLKCLVQLRPTRAFMAGKFSSEHYIVGGIGILLAIICAVIIHTILTTAETPHNQNQLGDARVKTPGEAQLESVPEPAHLSRAENGGEHRNWRPSRWQAS
jgi:CHASE1-domain containing sensor protein